ncbi:ATP-binding protein [Mariniflexile litorale]|uniref:histidine kinase n=1 Tax=Mariniflexile litorale TaxID=3045158 RepID=A0AAU7ECP1_9FLAO|nr:ATP-binding protein [Mariniflexile sp. KMM 9835]MDQ8213441.1 ATP-binding protein [Mariniflexile sp. KMM 9835]
MKIKDIVNRDLVTLTNCEHEPIHIPGSIQPHGFLIGLTMAWNIDFCSDNISSFIDISLSEVIGKHFDTIFGTEAHRIIQDFITNEKKLSVFPLEMDLLDNTFQLTIHKSDDIYVLECEPTFLEKENLVDVYAQTMTFLSHMNSSTSLKGLCGFVAEGIRQITGYDRVMIYRFDDQYNGEVYAENCREDLEPFLGLHYPHTDIPVQARALYLKNQLRFIVDIGYTPVPIFTTDDDENKNLDLSLSILRSTSPIHVEYLKNMGVGATLTISLIHEGRLWGLIACHHYSVKNISPEVRLAAKLQGQFITSQIDLRQATDEYAIARKTSIALEKLTGLDLSDSKEPFKILISNQNLLQLSNAVGVSIKIGPTIYKNGVTPTHNQIDHLITAITDSTNDKMFITNKLRVHFPELDYGEEIAGIIYHSLGNGNSIIWYRPETISEINWGGDPEKAIIKDSKGLHPRNSFNLWKQIVKNQSSVWLQPELNSAAHYAHWLYNQIILMMLREEQERYRSQSHILKEANAELENINWISTHDLQEPLRKIQIIISRLLIEIEETPTVDVVGYLNRVSKSANRMQILLQDILKYIRIKNNKDTLEKMSLNFIMDDTLDAMKDDLLKSGAVIECQDLPEVYGTPYLMKQLFSHIIQNALKYASPERSPILKITASKTPVIINDSHKMYCQWIKISDNGIGLEQQYASSIFKIFTRLHTMEKYTGSGVGLAICKKIMQNFGGSIEASGALNKGTTITLYFPYEGCDQNQS